MTDNREPVTIKGMCRLGSPRTSCLFSCVGSLIKARILTIFSPFLPDIFAQSSGFVVFGRSSFSWYSSRIAALRSAKHIPLSIPSEPIKRLIAVFFARETMFFDHCTTDEVFKKEGFPFTAGVSYLNEPIFISGCVHFLCRFINEVFGDSLGISIELLTRIFQRKEDMVSGIWRRCLLHPQGWGGQF